MNSGCRAILAQEGANFGTKIYNIAHLGASAHGVGTAMELVRYRQGRLECWNGAFSAPK